MRSLGYRHLLLGEHAPWMKTSMRAYNNRVNRNHLRRNGALSLDLFRLREEEQTCLGLRCAHIRDGEVSHDAELPLVVVVITTNGQ